MLNQRNLIQLILAVFTLLFIAAACQPQTTPEQIEVTETVEGTPVPQPAAEEAPVAELPEKDETAEAMEIEATPTAVSAEAVAKPEAVAPELSVTPTAEGEKTKSEMIRSGAGIDQEFNPETEITLITYIRDDSVTAYRIYDNSQPTELVVEYFVFSDADWNDQDSKDIIDDCGREFARNHEFEFEACVYAPADYLEEMVIVEVTGSFDGPTCYLAIDEIEVYAREEYNTIDMIVSPDQTALSWSSTNLTDDQIWRQHSYRNDDGCSVLTLGHNPNHPDGINFEVKNSSDVIIWDEDLWLKE